MAISQSECDIYIAHSAFYKLYVEMCLERVHCAIIVWHHRLTEDKYMCQDLDVHHTIALNQSIWTNNRLRWWQRRDDLNPFIMMWKCMWSINRIVIVIQTNTHISNNIEQVQISFHINGSVAVSFEFIFHFVAIIKWIFPFYFLI